MFFFMRRTIVVNHGTIIRFGYDIFFLKIDIICRFNDTEIVKYIAMLLSTYAICKYQELWQDLVLHLNDVARPTDWYTLKADRTLNDVEICLGNPLSNDLAPLCVTTSAGDVMTRLRQCIYSPVFDLMSVALLCCFKISCFSNSNNNKKN